MECKAMNSRVVFSSATCRWATPQDFFDELNDEFHFTLDVCAEDDNAKCANYYTPNDDGLLQPWAASNWCNPPYGNGVYHWLEKARREKMNGNTTVLLLPSRTDTKWFHYHVLPHADEIRFIKGRLRFGGSKENAPFPSMLVIFKGDEV